MDYQKKVLTTATHPERCDGLPDQPAFANSSPLMSSGGRSLAGKPFHHY
jgi:hypothetical protein